MVEELNNIVKELDIHLLKDIEKITKEAVKEKDTETKSGYLLISKIKLREYLAINLDIEPKKYLEESIRYATEGHSKQILQNLKKFISFYEK